MPCVSWPDVRLLWEIQKTVTYPYAYTKIQHAIEYLEEFHERERQSSGEEHGTIIFMDGFDHYSGDAFKERWGRA